MNATMQMAMMDVAAALRASEAAAAKFNEAQDEKSLRTSAVYEVVCKAAYESLLECIRVAGPQAETAYLLLPAAQQRRDFWKMDRALLADKWEALAM